MKKQTPKAYQYQRVCKRCDRIYLTKLKFSKICPLCKEKAESKRIGKIKSRGL